MNTFTIRLLDSLAMRFGDKPRNTETDMAHSFSVARFEKKRETYRETYRGRGVFRKKAVYCGWEVFRGHGGLRGQGDTRF